MIQTPSSHPIEARAWGLLVLYDDVAAREYAYWTSGRAARVGTFTQTLDNEAKAKGWIVISMKNDWNRIFSFEK